MEANRKLKNSEIGLNVSVINIENLGFASYDRVLFQDLNLNIKRGEVTAITGKSGSGKTVLLKILAGLEQQEEGRFDVNPKAKVIFISQEPEDVDISQNLSIRDTLKSARGLDQIEAEMSACEEKFSDPNDGESSFELYGDLIEQYQELGGYSSDSDMERVLAGLGIDKNNTANITLETKLSDVSSGQLRKILIAKALYSKADIILLDEPSSHLDVQSVKWLSNYLNNTDSAVVITSNDSTLVDSCAKQTVGLTDSGRAFVFSGGITDFISKRDAIIQAEKLEAEQVAGKLKQLKKTDDKFRSRQVYKRSADMAQVGRALASRMARLKNEYEKMPGSKQVYTEEKIRDLIFTQERRSGDDVASIVKVVKKYDDYEAVNIRASDPITISRGEKWLFWGPNGSGKSTLARMIVDTATNGKFIPDQGEIKIGTGINISYYYPDTLPKATNGTLLKVMTDSMNKSDQGRYTSILRFFGFSTSTIHNQDLRTLSTGEKKRFSLALIMASQSNFIILDEPTGDYMSEEIKDRLANAISEFEGTLILVSHDQKFIEKASVDHILEMPSGKVVIK
jgi:ATP-binding cassette subfamily F protein 3